MRIGLPRALQTYRYLELWRGFLAGLGLEVLVSEPTDRRMVVDGVRLAPAELCLPCKVFLGHLTRLRDRVDVIFVPRIDCRRVKGELFFGCPKEMALPDMVRALLPGLPVVELVIDERQMSEAESFRRIAERLGRGRQWRQAYNRAQQDRAAAAAAAGPGGNCSARTVDDDIACAGRRPVRVGVVGHDYLVRDALLTLDVLKRLEELGAVPVAGQQVAGAASPTVKPRFLPNWVFEQELLSAAADLIGRRLVDGLLLVTSFACGTSAVTNELIRLMVQDSGENIPVLQLLFDEHTGEAGLATRLESFVDVIRLRQR